MGPMMTTPPAAIEFVDEARVAPLTQLDLARDGRIGRFNGGVYRADGSVVEAGLHVKDRYRNEPDALATGAEAMRVPGAHLFGGMLQNTHFGHFMVESLGRLWAAGQLRQVDSVVFYPRHLERPLPGYAKELLWLLGIEADICLASSLMQFETLAVPTPMVTRSGYLAGYPAARRMTQELRGVGRGAGAKKLYVSRSRLNPRDGAILLEERIEQNLEREGYTVIHPERLTIAQQLAHYNSAEHLVFADGSALHLYALVARPDQRVFVVWRRKRNGMFGWQIRSFGGAVVEGAPCVQRLWVPEVSFGAMAQAKAVLDFDDLRRQLVAGGFIGGDGWRDPGAADFSEALERIRTLTKLQYAEQTDIG